MTDLSIILPSRNEMFLARTIQDILTNSRGSTEIIAVLDGQWASPPIPDHPRVILIYHPESVGQRAAANDGARVASGKYIMKVDAHCAFDEGFDVKLMADMQPDWTVVPIMRNLHIFDWLCPNGHRRYQGPSGPCKECGEPTTMDIVWIAKKSPQSTSYCFDPTPHFNYFGEFKKRPEGQGDLTETMSLQGSCFMMTREKYFDLNICDESFGSWGSQGIEVACKTWLSGGRVMVNHKTWQAHLFRTQGQDFGFPYSLSGKQVANAKRIARDLFFENKWPRQIHPLSWLIEKFWPIPGWSEEDLSALRMKPFPHPDFLNNFFSVSNVISPSHSRITDGTTPRTTVNLIRQDVSIGAMGFVGINETNGIFRDKHMLSMTNELQVEGITTGRIVAGMMENGIASTPSAVGEWANNPSVDEAVSKGNVPRETNIPIAAPIFSTQPDPTISDGIEGINLDLGKDSSNINTRQMEGFSEILAGSHSEPPIQVSSRLELERVNARSNLSIISRKSILYYTCLFHPPDIEAACRKQLLKSGLPIVSVSRGQDIDFGDTRIVLQGDRSPLMMHRQVLAGLEACEADVVYLCESDVLYHPSHFDFTPAHMDIFYFNTNVWKVRYPDGHAIWTDDLQQISGICASRELLLDFFRRRVKRIQRDGFNGHYEPGPRYGSKVENWQSPTPNVDIRHDMTITKSKWSPEEFRNREYAKGWKESNEVTGWGVIEGRFMEFLNAMD